MKSLLLGLISFLPALSFANADVCRSVGQFIPIEFPKGKSRYSSYINGVQQPAQMVEMEPQYIRVHPSGNYVIASLENGTAVIVDITDKFLPKVIKTPLRNEATPLEPSWDYISSPYDKKGMEYYSFDDLVNKGEEAKSKFSDYRHNQYYQSLSEYPNSTAAARRFRVVLFSTLSSRDYEVRPLPDKSKALVTKGKLEYLCENIQQDFYQPILSKDGKEMGVNLPRKSDENGRGGETVILKIGENGKCDVEERLGYATSKLAFPYPQEGKKGLIAYTSLFTSGSDGEDRAAVRVFDRDKKTTYLVSSPWTEEIASYPGFTKSGDLIYAAKRNGTNGLVYIKKEDLGAQKPSSFAFPEDESARCKEFADKTPKNRETVTPNRAKGAY